MNVPKLFAPPHPAYASRRQFLARAGGGFGLLALSGLLQQEGLLAAPEPVNPLASKEPHFPTRAKSVIWSNGCSNGHLTLNGDLGGTVLTRSSETCCPPDCGEAFGR